MCAKYPSSTLDGTTRTYCFQQTAGFDVLFVKSLQGLCGRKWVASWHGFKHSQQNSTPHRHRTTLHPVSLYTSMKHDGHGLYSYSRPRSSLLSDRDFVEWVMVSVLWHLLDRAA